MRFWHSTPKLHRVPVVVWSVMGEDQRKMCDLFKVTRYVGKWEGNGVLQLALENIIQTVN